MSEIFNKAFHNAKMIKKTLMFRFSPFSFFLSVSPSQPTQSFDLDSVKDMMKTGKNVLLQLQEILEKGD
jgi:hypothetical protein